MLHILTTRNRRFGSRSSPPAEKRSERPKACLLYTSLDKVAAMSSRNRAGKSAQSSAGVALSRCTSVDAVSVRASQMPARTGAETERKSCAGNTNNSGAVRKPTTTNVVICSDRSCARKYAKSAAARECNHISRNRRCGFSR